MAKRRGRAKQKSHHNPKTWNEIFSGPSQSSTRREEVDLLPTLFVWAFHTAVRSHGVRMYAHTVSLVSKMFIPSSSSSFTHVCI